MERRAAAALAPTGILLVEDDASDAWLLQNALDGTCPGEFTVMHARSLEEALPCLQQPCDVALLDMSLPGSSDMEALKGLRHAAPQLPVIILTGYDNEALALTSLKHGAQDYLVKERYDGHLIKRAIRYAIERKHFEDSLTQLANYDGLTGLPNRVLFQIRLELALARARRSGEPLAVFFLDLDRFKQVNDRLGHEAGDALLKNAAARLRGALRECDTVARFGGDEFAVLLEGTAEPRNCAIVAQKMIDMLGEPFTLEGGEATVGISIGIAIGMPGTGAEELLRHADTAMYRAKNVAESNYQFYTEHMHREIVKRMQLERDLALAIRGGNDLCLHYQPKLDIASGWLVGAEALIRWRHGQRGMLHPAEFLPLLPPAMAAELDQWVVETVCRDIQRWQEAGLNPLQISIHIAQRQWANTGMAHGLFDMLAAAGLQTECLAVEVEESAMQQDDGRGFDALARVRETGIEVHLDNFGVDVSSLRLLTHCPLDVIKIDRHLTDGVDSKEQHVVMVQALINLGHQLGLKVVAEGVETPQQRQALSDMACDQIQGIIISKPLPANDFFHWVDTRPRRAS